MIDLAARRRRSASAAGRTPCRSRSPNASRLSTVTLTLTYDPAMLRVRTVQEGSFMRSGGVDAAFTQQVEPATASTSRSRAPATRPARPAPACWRRCCSTPSRRARATLTLSGTATGPGGTAMGLQFRAGDGHRAAVDCEW